MRLVLELHFDEETENRIRRVWSKLAELGCVCDLVKGGARPHITLAMFDSVDSDALHAALDGVSCVNSPIELEFSGLGVFPPNGRSVFLLPACNGELIAIHHAIHDQLHRINAESYAVYRPRRWIPHCTLSTNLTSVNLSQVLDLCLSENAFQGAMVTDIRLVQYYPAQEVFVVPLRCGSHHEDNLFKK